MSEIRLYNSMSRSLEVFEPIQPPKVNMYVCGPTVYNLIHIGNARPLCVFDCIRRYLIYKGFDVNYITNFTDVDDKIIRRANEENVSSKEIADKYITEFFTDSDGLGVMRADVYPKATEEMGAIIDLVQTLIDKGYAYESDGDVYFSALKFDGYGKLSHMPIDDLVSGARVDVSDKKREPLDFALWKAAKPGEPSWQSPWGEGRPGWHIECSAMSGRYADSPNTAKYTLDIHGGGQDLMFPHHENEIAQSEAARGVQSGHGLAKYWLHNGFINIDNSKMSKSKGNFFTVRDVAKKYGYEAIRLFQIQAHYRNPINYTVDLMDSCKASLQRLHNCRDTLDTAIKLAIVQATDTTGSVSANVQSLIDNARNSFISAMDMDFNTADALAVLFELTTSINILVSGGEASQQELEALAAVFDEIAGVLGIVQNRDKRESDSVPAEVTDLATKRTEAKKNKDYKLADEIREKIVSLGYNIEDTRQGLKITEITKI